MVKLRKAFIISVATVTVLSMSLFAVPFEVGAAAQAGDLIKMDGLSSVYYLGADSKRYVFPNEATYFSWYNDFSGVVVIPQSELESYPLGANVVMRAGTKLVKITTDPKVYAVEPNGTLRWVPSEATAATLYGADWAKKVVDVPDAFFTNYTVSTTAVEADAYPEGSLVKFEGADVYYIDADGKARKVADEAAFLANRFKWGDVISATIAMPTAGTELSEAEGEITDTSQGGGGTGIDPNAGTGLTVAIASDTPAAGNIPDGSFNDFVKFNLTASNDGPVNVNSIKLNAYDLGNATYIDGITFFKDGVKVGTAKDMSSDRYTTFNFASPIVVPAGQTVSLLVKATIDATANGGNYALGMAEAASVITNGAAVSGSFPLVGNTQAVVNVTIGTMTLSGVDGTDTTGVQFGEDDVLLASFNLAAATEAIIWDSAMFRNGGTNNDSLFTNLRLVIDGDEVATGEIVDRYATFDVGNFLVAKNDSVSVEIYGDAGIGNVGDTMALYIKDINDLGFVGQDFGYGISLTGHADLDTSTEGKTITLAAGDVTLDIDKAAAPAADVRAGDNDVVLAVLKITSNGENATLDSLADSGVVAGDFYLSGTNPAYNVAEISDVELRDTDTGTIYDVSTTATTTGWLLSMTEEIYFMKGVTKTFELRADLSGPTDTNQIDEDDTLRLTLKSTAFTMTGTESDADLTGGITPSSVAGSVMTVKSASLRWTTVVLNDDTFVPGASNEIVYQAALKAGASSYVDVTSVTVHADNTTYAAFTNSNIASLGLYRVDADNPSGVLMKSKSNGIVNGGAANAYVTFNSLPSANRRLAAGAEAKFEVRATFASSFAVPGAFKLNIESATADIVASDKDNNNVAESVISTDTDTRQVTLAAAGTLKAELIVTDDDADVDTYILAGSETTHQRYMGTLKFTTTNEEIKVKTLVLGQSGSGTASDVSRIKLYDPAGTVVASVAPTASGHANFDTLNLVLDADKVTKYHIGVETNSIGTGAGDTATYANTLKYGFAGTAVLTNAQIGLLANQAVTAQGMDSGEEIAMTEATGAVIAGQYEGSSTTTKETKLTGSVLTSVVNNLADGSLPTGEQEIARFKMTFDNGDNENIGGAIKAKMQTLKLTFAKSANISIASSSIQAYWSDKTSEKTSGISDAADQALLDLSGLDDVDGEVELVVIANIQVGGTGSTAESFRAEIDNLATDLVYDGNDGDGGNLTGARLDYTEVKSGNLTRNQ
jgi:hypothetical protein